MTRNHADFIDSFCELTDHLPSPKPFREWTAIYMLGAVMEQKIFLHTGFGILYPHFYVILVGGPGAGKSIITTLARNMLAQVEGLHIAPNRMSKAALLDVLAESNREIITPDGPEPRKVFQSLNIISHELTVLLEKYDPGFMGALTNFWDAGEHFDERLRTNAHKLQITSPQVSLLAATTPSFFAELMPEAAWQQGFLTRTMVCYSGEETTTSLFKKNKNKKELQETLIEDLVHINSRIGEFTFSEETVDKIDEWHMAKGPPTPTHPRLMQYLTRRSVHLLKLCMVSCISRGDGFVIELQDYDRAMHWLLELEGYLPDLFKEMSGGGDKPAMEDLWNAAWDHYIAKDSKPIPEQFLFAFLSGRVPSQRVPMLLDVMVRAGYFKTLASPAGDRYIPLDPTDAHM